MASATLVQVELESGTTRRTCWVEPQVRVGNEITLKGSEDPVRRWRVVSVGHEVARSNIRTDWRNNI